MSCQYLYQNVLLKSTAILMLSFATIPVLAQIPKYNSNSAAPATVYLDFDGQVVQGTSWNWDSTIHAQPSGLSSAVITEVFNRVAEDYRIFNINITTDSTVYNKAPIGLRVRIIVTPTSHWYGLAGGISFVNSFIWGDGTPSWVFSDVLQNNPKYIGEACSHEAGHTLGLQHQSTYDKSCALVTEYAEGKGSGEISWAPIMGLSYYRNLTTWNIGKSIEGCSIVQNDISTIAYGMNHIGLRTDDHGNTMAAATPINFSGSNFASTGMINSGTDVDVFKFVMPHAGGFKTNVIPSNVGANNSGANIDLKVSLVKSNGDTIGRYNPANLVSASIDTTLNAGTYYVVVDGVGNENLIDYSSVGFYTMTGAENIVLPVASLVLKGTVTRNTQGLSWEFISDEAVNSTVVEYSGNGVDFKTLITLAPSVLAYQHNSLGRAMTYYRIKMLAGVDNTPYYSNIIALENVTSKNITLQSNMIQNTALIDVSGDYNYDIFDATGRLLQRGKLADGYNSVQVNTAIKGLLLLKVYNNTAQSLFKLIKQ